jgi:hypothetical protein
MSARASISQQACRVELVVMYYARLTDRHVKLTDVLRQLDRETLVLVCQRLGYPNIFSRSQPSLFYRLRMWRPDDNHVAHVLCRLAMEAHTPCIKYFGIDGVERKVTEGPGIRPPCLASYWLPAVTLALVGRAMHSVHLSGLHIDDSARLLHVDSSGRLIHLDGSRKLLHLDDSIGLFCSGNAARPWVALLNCLTGASQLDCIFWTGLPDFEQLWRVVH